MVCICVQSWVFPMDESWVILMVGSSVFPMEGGWIFAIPRRSRVFLKISFKQCRLKKKKTKQNNKNKVTLTDYYTCRISNREGARVKDKNKWLTFESSNGSFSSSANWPGTSSSRSHVVVGSWAKAIEAPRIRKSSTEFIFVTTLG